MIGCTPKFLRVHIEGQFEPGMSFENRELWHLDHIRPLSSYDLRDPIQQAASMHWTNLKPVWAAENMAKGSLHEGKRWRHGDHE